MRAVRFIGNGVVEVFEKPIPQPKDHEILVKVAYCGLCGSEKTAVKNGFDRVVPGHETTGVIERLGAHAKRLKIGSPVLIYLSDYCGECDACRDGNTSQCSNRRGLIGWGFDGGYEEYVAIPDHMVYPLDDLPLDLGVLALDTIGTAFHALRQSDISRDSQILVIGCGPIGMGCISILKNHYGVKELYAADISDFHCDMAQKLGASPIPVDALDTCGSIEKVLGKRRMDRVIEVCGIDATLSAAAKFVRAGGKIAYIGEPVKALTLVRTSDWILKDFCLINSWYFPAREIPDNIAFIKAHRDQVEKLITDVYPLQSMTEAYEKFFGGGTGKVLISLRDE